MNSVIKFDGTKRVDFDRFLKFLLKYDSGHKPLVLDSAGPCPIIGQSINHQSLLGFCLTSQAGWLRTVVDCTGC